MAAEESEAVLAAALCADMLLALPAPLPAQEATASSAKSCWKPLCSSTGRPAATTCSTASARLEGGCSGGDSGEGTPDGSAACKRVEDRHLMGTASAGTSEGKAGGRGRTLGWQRPAPPLADPASPGAARAAGRPARYRPQRRSAWSSAAGRSWPAGGPAGRRPWRGPPPPAWQRGPPTVRPPPGAGGTAAPSPPRRLPARPARAACRGCRHRLRCLLQPASGWSSSPMRAAPQPAAQPLPPGAALPLNAPPPPALLAKVAPPVALVPAAHPGRAGSCGGAVHAAEPWPCRATC